MNTANRQRTVLSQMLQADKDLRDAKYQGNQSLILSIQDRLRALDLEMADLLSANQ